jgi:AraC-like DNA-binding protein
MATLLYAGALDTPVDAYRQHRHDHWELVLYTAGRGTITVGGTPHRFAPGRIFALPPALPHSETADAGAPFRNLHIGVRGLPRGGTRVCDDDAEQTFLHAAQALVREQRCRPPGWRATSAALLDLLLVYLERWTATVDPLVADADERLHAALAQPGFRIAALAQRLGVSDDTLRRRFTAVHGEGPQQRLLRLRLEKSRLLLARGARVGDAAGACGFTDAAYFSRAFRAAFGRPPSAECAG